MVEEILENSFEEKVDKSSLPVLVDFSATWCPPCKMLAPVIEKIAEEYKGKLAVYGCNTDEAPGLAQRFNIHGVPTMIFFKDNKEVNRIVGYRDFNTLKREVDSFIG